MTPTAPSASNRRRFVLASLPLLMLLATPAVSAPAFKDWRPGTPCFARSYDASHLGAHPKQRLTHFALAASRLAPTEKGTFEVTFSFRVKGHSSVYEAEGICRGGPHVASCGVEGDGGQFTMKADGDGLLLTISRIAVEGEADFSPELGVGGDDRLVRLHPAPKSACRFN